MQQCYCNLSYFTIPHANLTMVEAGIEYLPTIAAKMKNLWIIHLEEVCLSV